MSFVNGFGAHEQLKHQIIPGPSGSERDLSSSSLLQVLARYCKAESPYIAAFVAHYQVLFANCHFIFAVQNKNDAKSLEEALRASTATFSVHVLGNNADSDLRVPDLWRGLCMDLVRKSPYHYTLLCDPDEFIHYSYSGISLAALLHELKACGAQLHVPWCMAPLPATKGRFRGFFGHIGKPLAPSSLIRNIASDHCFSCAKGTSSLPLGPLGVFLIHYWGRTFNDILIKDFCRLIQDGKSHGLSPGSIISSGTLTPRLKILAYLDCQRRFLRVPDFISGFVDECAEEELLQLVMTDRQRRKIQKLYQSYRRKIAIECLPTYPLLNLSDALKYLPA